MVYRICTRNHAPKGHPSLRFAAVLMVSDVIARFTVAQPDVAGTVIEPEEQPI